MAKVSIGLRGWRFDEDAVFDADGEVRDIAEMPEDTRNRLLRLGALLDEPCSACWLIHGQAEIERCNRTEVVYGEPLAEVVLCADHERHFVYWFREEGGSEHAGTATLQDEFHEWFADGNRAPEGYEGIDHVDRAPGELPEPMPEQSLEEVAAQAAELDDAEAEALNIELDDLDV